MRPTRRTLMLAAPALLAAPGARAQAWPDRPVRVIVAFTAGGTTDIIARLVGNQLSQLWGQPVVVENRPGAGGNIGTEAVVRSAPDGYTLLVGSNGPMAVNHSLYRSLPYDARRDLSAVTLLAEVQNLLVVPQASPIRDVAGLVALARSRRNEPLSYGSTGVGTASHLAGALLSRMLEVELTHVPYRGAVAVNDLLSRRLDFMFATAPSVNEQVRSGQLRALAVSGRRRSRSMPELPTMEESGFPGFDASSWFGMAAPARTPPEIVTKIATDAIGVLRRPEIERALVEQGADPVGNTPAEFTAFIASEIERWSEVVRAAGATAD
ncbi:Bug family tripartite tricarboxylate transporter substrate binding protein [Sabulicella rubraurantiaca]|uniref:Bug family tripartite tricarboxylate transporter substrate binding protein n=1 Tax=Sabulicella rubraurantiaca TaxID=2811429 RepID=UPI001A969339|nr:tripartite tricarboxylate transporter substrate binding protein [Sabulicella rubraurantiaca]